MKGADVDQTVRAKQILSGLRTGSLYYRQAAEELCELLKNEPTVTFSALDITSEEFITLLRSLAPQDRDFQRILREVLPPAVRFGNQSSVIELKTKTKRAS